MAQKPESLPNSTETTAENPWDTLTQLGTETSFSAAANETAAETSEKVEPITETPNQKHEKIAQAAAKVRASYNHQTTSSAETASSPTQAGTPNIPQETPTTITSPLPPAKPSFAQNISAKYAAGERARVDRLKSQLNFSTAFDYKNRAIATEPTTLQKTFRMLTDKLGIKTKRGEKQREREAMHTALTEYRQEEQAREQAFQEEQAREAARRQRLRAQMQAEQERQEQAAIARDMSTARDAFDSHQQYRLKKQRIQEIVERDLNSRLLTVNDLEIEVLSNNPGIQKRSETFEDTEIPIYDLKGLPFTILSTTIDYRSANEPGEIGTETYKTLMENPAIWTERRDQAQQATGFGTRNANARGDTISASYYNSERNIDSHVSGDLIYGFAKVEADSIVSINNGDGGTSNMAGQAETSLDNPNILKTLEGANGTYIYNEVLLRRYSENGVPKRPDYIIVENGKITESALKHAKFFKIPIVNIDRQTYAEKASRRGQEILESISTDDSYEELDHKMDELLSMTEYKNTLRQLQGIGRSYDIPQVLNYFTDLDRKCLEISKMEQLKRLNFIANALKTATQELKAATAAGHSNPNVLKQFDYFDIEIQDVQNQTRSIPSFDSTDSSYSNPGNCNWIDIKFRLKGSSRIVETQVYDGARIYKADEALAAGVRNQKDLENADSSFYDQLEPLVRDYFKAYRENQN